MSSSGCLQVQQLIPEMPETGGLLFHVNAKKPADLVVKQVRLKLVGDPLWQVLSEVIGPKLIATFKLAIHPVALCPDFMDPNNFKKGSEVVHTSILLGAAGKYRAKKRTLIKKMTRIIAAGDPEFVIELEYGDKRLTWRAEGILYSFSTKISDILRGAETNSCVVNKPVSVPQILRVPPTPEEFRQSPFAKLSREDMRKSMKQIVKVFPKLDPSLETEEAQTTIRMKSQQERISIYSKDVDSPDNTSSDSPVFVSKMDDAAGILDDLVNAANQVVDNLEDSEIIDKQYDSTEDNGQTTNLSLPNHIHKNSTGSTEPYAPKEETPELPHHEKENNQLLVTETMPSNRRNSSEQSLIHVNDRKTDVVETRESKTEFDRSTNQLPHLHPNTNEREMQHKANLTHEIQSPVMSPLLRAVLPQKNGTQWTSFYFVLKQGHLFKYASEHDFTAGKAPLDDILLEDCQFEQQLLSNDVYCVEIKAPTRSIMIRAKGLEDMCNWIVQLVQHKFVNDPAKPQDNTHHAHGSNKHENKLNHVTALTKTEDIYTDEIKRRKDKLLEEEKQRKEKEKLLKEQRERVFREAARRQREQEEKKREESKRSLFRRGRSPTDASRPKLTEQSEQSPTNTNESTHSLDAIQNQHTLHATAHTEEHHHEKKKRRESKSTKERSSKQDSSDSDKKLSLPPKPRRLSEAPTPSIKRTNEEKWSSTDVQDEKNKKECIIS